jgi:hypothetical protein
LEEKEGPVDGSTQQDPKTSRVETVYCVPFSIRALFYCSLLVWTALMRASSLALRSRSSFVFSFMKVTIRTMTKILRPRTTRYMSIGINANKPKPTSIEIPSFLGVSTYSNSPNLVDFLFDPFEKPDAEDARHEKGEEQGDPGPIPGPIEIFD